MEKVRKKRNISEDQEASQAKISVLVGHFSVFHVLETPPTLNYTDEEAWWDRISLH